MADDRKALEVGARLLLGKTEYIIQEEIGRGASCICYGASYLDSAGLPHEVRIKEFYPYGLGVARDGLGALQAASDVQPLFWLSQGRFQEAYRNHVALKRIMGIANSTVDAMDISHSGNTSYVVMGCMEGVDYRKEMDNDAQSVFIRMAALAKIIQKYHSHGILHLDMKPENILIIPETLEHLVLFDFGSLAPWDSPMGQEGAASCVPFAASEGIEAYAPVAASEGIGAYVPFAGKEGIEACVPVAASEGVGSCVPLARRDYFSHSDGFSAPELCRQEIGRIGPATDIYSIGAIVFYKLFGRTPKAWDRAVGASYDFASMHFQDSKYPPGFFAKLETFFHKSIASAAGRRYQDAGEVLEALQELANLSDTGQVYLCPGFSYHFEDFIGRERELAEISRQLSRRPVVFLSGMGGIGKTETAKRFAYEYQEEFRNVLFVPFQGSLLETVCGGEIQIHSFARETGESDGDFFVRKLGVLKQVASQEDLLILDNFDVEGDGHLEQLLSCPCKFLITSRNDFKDYHYAQVKIGAMGQEEGLEALFHVYNQKEYGEGEQAAVRDILRFVEGHTMTVELIAKYLRDVETAPSQFLAKLMEKEGIAAVEGIGIRLRKDRKLQEENVSRHLQALFGLSGFAGIERKILQSLSLLGPIRIRRETFLDCCMGEGQPQEVSSGLDSLIRRGFIQYQEEEGKLSLHQLILDMAYDKLRPDSRQCPHMVDAMKAYMQKEYMSRTEGEAWDKLLGIFAERLKGDDLRYASFLAAYCSRFPRRGSVPVFLGKAEAVCKESPETEAKGCLEKIYYLKAKQNFRYLEENIEEFEAPESLLRVAEETAGLIKTSFQYALGFSHDAGYLGKRCLAYGKCLENMVNQVEVYEGLWEEEGRVRGFDLLLSCAAGFYQEAEKYLLEPGLPAEEKINGIRQIQEFYSDEDFTALYRCAFYADAKKAYGCQQIMDRLLEESRGSGVVVIDGISIDAIAREALGKGRYEEAAYFFNKEIEGGPYAWRDKESAYTSLGEVYLKMGDLGKAVRLWEEAIAWKKGEGEFASNLCGRLIPVLLTDGKREAAREYALDYTAYYLGRYQENHKEGLSYLPNIIKGEFWLYQLEEDPDEKAKDWEACLLYYRRLPAGSLPEDILDFLEAYLEKIQGIEERLAYAYRLVREPPQKVGWEAGYVRIIAYIARICKEQWENVSHTEGAGKRKAAYQYSKALAAYSRSLVWEDFRKEGQALPYAMEADRIYRSQGLEEEYLYSLIHCALSECSEDLGKYQEEKEKCNYYLLAQREVQGTLPEQAVGIWERAADNLLGTGRWELQELCYGKIREIYDSAINPFQDDKAFWKYWEIFMRRLSYSDPKGPGQRERRRKETLCMYRELVSYLIPSDVSPSAFGKEEMDMREKFCKSLEGLASQLARIGCLIESAALYALEILAAAGGCWEREVFDGIESYFTGDMDRLSAKFSDALQGTLSPGQVDSIFFYWRKMQGKVQDAGCFRPFEAAFQQFRKAYQEKEISFKREDG